AVFRMNALALFESKSPVQRANVYDLFPSAYEPHFDPRFIFQKGCGMSEAIRAEIGAQFSVYSQEKVLIECFRNAGCIIVGGIEYFRVLHQVNAGKDVVRRVHPPANRQQELNGFISVKVADIASKEHKQSRNITVRQNLDAVRVLSGYCGN